MNNVLKKIIFALLIVIAVGFCGVCLYSSAFKVAKNLKEEIQIIQPHQEQAQLPGNQSPQEDAGVSDEELEEKFLYNLDTILSYIDYYYYDEMDREKVYDAMLHAAVSSLGDPYSVYYSPEEYLSLMEDSSGVYSGIGATISQNMQTMVMTVVKPFVDSPALKAGILPGDEIIGVDGENVICQDLNEVVKRIKGVAGTTVDVTVLRNNEELTFTVTRASINVEFCSYRMLNDKVGYIMVSEFEKTTAQQFRDAIKNLKAQGMEGLVIDIRDNPGGMYNIVCEMLDSILPKGSLLVYTEDKYGTRECVYAESSDELDIPIAVLVNGNSASASEIFSGALQDYDAATIIGTQTFGKGIVQSVWRITDENDGLKITVSRYFTPSGVCIHGIGITPDIVIELDEEFATQLIEQRETDNQIDKAIEVIMQQLK